MPTCQNCHHTWSYTQTLKKFFLIFESAMTCPFCNETQFQTKKSVRKGHILNFAVLLPFLIRFFFNTSGLFTLLLFPILFIIIMAIYPFLIEVSSEKENFIFK